jgi:hypothetical protein
MIFVASIIISIGLVAAESKADTSCKAVDQATSPPNAIQLACVTDCSHPPSPLTPEQRASLDAQLAANIDEIRLGLWHRACDKAQQNK